VNNSEIKLVKLMDVIRKDSGVNNAVDAMEQLSLILLLQYFYNAILVGSSKINPANDFESLFFKKNKFHVKEIDENF
jgi:type I restriction enzyme M protein